MKFLSWLIGLPLAVLIVLFALSNRQGVAVGLWPFEEGVVLPVFLAVLLPLLAGFLLGFVTAGARGLKHRRNARIHAKRAAALERELDAKSASPPAEPPPNQTNPPT